MLIVLPVQADLQSGGQRQTGLQWIDQRVHMPARRGILGVQPLIVIGACLIDPLLQFVRNRLPSS